MSIGHTRRAGPPDEVVAAPAAAGTRGPGTAGERRLGLDALRGVAVLLMVLDHALVVAAPGNWLRYTVTRVSLPLFCLVAGYLLNVARPELLGRRLWTVLGAGIVATPLGIVVGIGQPDVLLVLVVALVTVRLLYRHGIPPALIVAGAMVVHQTWQLPAGYTGYGPYYLVGLVAVGLMVQHSMWRPGWLEAFPWRPAWLVWIGQRPLRLYVGHLALLAAVPTISAAT